MPILGLTGELASGKSTVLKLLLAKGASTFDIDEKIHSYYRNRKSPVYKKTVALFPEAVAGGNISRKKLGKIIFSDRNRLKKLESIVHPQAIKDLQIWIQKSKNKKKIYVAEVPLLFERKLASCFEGVILVFVKKGVLRQRIIDKYKLSQDMVCRRLKLYLPIREKINKADIVIDNSSSLKDLKKEVDFLWKRLSQK